MMCSFLNRLSYYSLILMRYLNLNGLTWYDLFIRIFLLDLTRHYQLQPYMRGRVKQSLAHTNSKLIALVI